MKKTLTTILTVVILVLSINVISSTTAYAASVPTADWGGSNGNGFYLTIQPVKGVSNYRVFIKYSVWNSGDNKSYSKWVKVKDVSKVNKSTSVYVNLPNSIKSKKKLNIRYTVRGMNRQYSRYTTGFVNRSRDLIRWSKYYECRFAKKNGNIHIAMTPDGRFENPTSKWELFVKNQKGKLVSVPFSYESAASLNRLILSKSVVNKYKLNGKLTFTARLKADVGSGKTVCWYWCGGYKTYTVSV